jgi:Ca2+-binding RTX toxin-like protein
MTSENNTELPEQIGLLIIDDYKNLTAFQNSRTCQSTVGKVTLITGVGGNFIYRSSDIANANPITPTPITSDHDYLSVTMNSATDGQSGNDVLIGAAAEKIYGGIGNDIIFGNAGDDVLERGGGNVTLSGDYKKKIDDHGTTDTNDDTYVITNGNYTPDETAPDGEANAPDLINGTHAIAGVGGKDVIDGKGGDDYLNGKSGDDHIEGGNGGDYIQGGLGKDNLNGGAGDDLIYGSSDEDIAMPTDINFTRPVNDWTHAQGTGFNWATGYNDSDVYSNGTPISSTRPVIRNRLANDQSNSIDGGDGNDFIAAGTGADYVHGGADKDLIWGMDKDDILFGDAGNDVIYGDGFERRAA